MNECYNAGTKRSLQCKLFDIKLQHKLKLSSKQKDKVLKDYYHLIVKNKKLIINENKKDIEVAKKNKIKNSLIQRLSLDDEKISNITNSIKEIIKLQL